MKLKYKLRRIFFLHKHEPIIREIAELLAALKYIRAEIQRYDRLMENGMLLEAGWKGAPIYTKAQTELILDSLDNTNKFLRGDKILYYDHKRNKSGKLISVKAKFDERKTIYTEV